VLDLFSVKLYEISEVTMLRVRLDLLCEEAMER